MLFRSTVSPSATAADNSCPLMSMLPSPVMQTTGVSGFPAAVPTAAPMAGSTTFTDDELKKFDDAMAKVRAVSDTLNGAQPTPEQQAEMAAAVQDSGLEVVRFNAISRAAADNPVIDARIRAMKAPPPVPGSVAAGVSEAELTQFVQAMEKIRAVTANVQNGQATPEQSAQLTAAVQGSGLAVDRFNAIAAAVSQDPGLRARAELIGARYQVAQ